jgi:hypothetical protein
MMTQPNAGRALIPTRPDLDIFVPITAPVSDNGVGKLFFSIRASVAEFTLGGLFALDQRLECPRDLTSSNLQQRNGLRDDKIGRDR